MSLSLHSIAVRGIGYGPHAMSALGYQETVIAPRIADATGSFPWPFAHPKSTHISGPKRRARTRREADLLLMYHL